MNKQSMKNIDQSIKILGISIFSNKKLQLLDFLHLHLQAKKPLLTIFTPNPEQVVQAKEDSMFEQALTEADLCIPDGIGLIGASKVLKFVGKTNDSLQERITGVEVMQALLEDLKVQGKIGLIIGGRNYESDLFHAKGVQKLGRDQLGKVQNSKLKIQNDSIVYWMEGYADVTKPSKEEEELVLEVLKSLKPAAVFVAFGAPHQEHWIIAHKQALQKADTSIAMVVGGAVDMYFGTVSRAPQFIRTVGLEWLYRLLTQPWRWRRQLRLVTFVKLVIQEAFR